MTDEAHIPVLCRVVHTDALPVELESKHSLRVWHDELGAWHDDDLDVGVENVEADSGTKIRHCIDEPPAGTLRICEMVPVDEHEED